MNQMDGLQQPNELTLTGGGQSCAACGGPVGLPLMPGVVGSRHSGNQILIVPAVAVRF